MTDPTTTWYSRRRRLIDWRWHFHIWGARCAFVYIEPRDGWVAAWAVYVDSDRDGDGQPVALRVLPTDGAHVAEADAEWLRAVIRDALANCIHDNHGGA